MYSINSGGVSEDRQPDIRRDEERARAWKFEAVVDAADHADIIQARGEVL
jgi:hypothetical protein